MKNNSFNATFFWLLTRIGFAINDLYDKDILDDANTHLRLTKSLASITD